MSANSSIVVSHLTLRQHHPLLYLLLKHAHCVSMHYPEFGRIDNWGRGAHLWRILFSLFLITASTPALSCLWRLKLERNRSSLSSYTGYTLCIFPLVRWYCKKSLSKPPPLKEGICCGSSGWQSLNTSLSVFNSDSWNPHSLYLTDLPTKHFFLRKQKEPCSHYYLFE